MCWLSYTETNIKQFESWLYQKPRDTLIFVLYYSKALPRPFYPLGSNNVVGIFCVVFFLSYIVSLVTFGIKFMSPPIFFGSRFFFILYYIIFILYTRNIHKQKNIKQTDKHTDKGCFWDCYISRFSPIHFLIKYIYFFNIY